eukprot:3128275-Rhodomonas_salina.1
MFRACGLVQMHSQTLQAMPAGREGGFVSTELDAWTRTRENSHRHTSPRLTPAHPQPSSTTDNRCTNHPQRNTIPPRSRQHVSQLSLRARDQAVTSQRSGGHVSEPELAGDDALVQRGIHRCELSVVTE